eukprot:Unigene9587_Nuclearia_a/m.29298 Unigene9587_Nuclearia_a/g.29298  ORF Unigene9587_Nuclearia_a/g.29298 Unigene9587_Nuclearia_a/m.29298 type:complete len:331 (-) Unigene9587_Nuclearia_a:44-1036(-)
MDHMALLEGDSVPHDALAAARSDPETYRKVGALLNSTMTPLHERFRALFTLRNLNGPLAVTEIARCFSDPSALLRHELAYVLGQMQDVTAVGVLSRVLETASEDPMVRHEAAEALGALAQEESLELLEKYRADPMKEVAETCEIAVDRVRYELRRRRGEINAQGSDGPGPYLSVDPAPPSAAAPTLELRAQLLDAGLPLFERYRAMFALRNRGDEASVLALADGLEDASALFRHEIAYVLGQIAHKAAVPALTRNLRSAEEHPMVRHECAEALGSIATPEVYPILEEFRRDAVAVVKESCEVALDMYAYENSGKLEYADGLQRISEAPVA